MAVRALLLRRIRLAAIATSRVGQPVEEQPVEAVG
jgi:hypothetical protein